MSDTDSYSSGSSNADPVETSWDDWTEDSAPATALFSADIFASAELALKHDKEVNGVDIVLLAATLDFFERIRLINWIRATKPAPSALQRLDRSQSSFLEDDGFLKPVIEDDPILQVDFDELLESLTGSAPAASSSATAAPATAHSDDADLVSILRAQLADTQLAFSSLKKVVQDRLGDSLGLDVVSEVKADTAEVPKPRARKEGELPKDSKGKERDDDSHYFESYAYNEIHEIMLKDRVRTNSYRDFILNNPGIFKDAVVLDVGCGTGVLSMFAAKCGAKKVYAVDASAIAFKAERNIKANGFSDVITVVKGKVEHIEIPEKVDVIVSEWMGYFLLYECMLDSVLHARERFMKPTGLMVPSQCSILLSLMDGARMMDDRVKFWDEVYGFDMTAMKEEIADDAMIDVMAHSEVVSDYATLSDVLTQTVTVPELSFTTPFTLTASKATTVHAFLGHFDTFFTTDGRLVPSAGTGVPTNAAAPAALGPTEVFFTTGTQDTPTHWKQTAFILREPIAVEAGDEVVGVFKCGKNPDNSRELVCEVTWGVRRAGQVVGKEGVQVWKVSKSGDGHMGNVNKDLVGGGGNSGAQQRQQDLDSARALLNQYNPNLQLSEQEKQRAAQQIKDELARRKG